jgi:CubicO group peptidase (beta-lactamase class C family)
MIVTHTLPRSIPEEQGVSSSAILNFLNEIEQQKLELHGLIIMRHGHVIAEGWWKPYQPKIPHVAYSLTKSFTSTAVGFAIQEGLMFVNDPILTYFPEMITPEIRENMSELRVRHLLTMTTGHQVDTTRFNMTSDFLKHKPDLQIGDRADGDYVRGFLESPIKYAPGTYFVYNSGASHVLGAIVERITGVPLVDYLYPRLFQPLGIEKPKWDRTITGGNTGGWGIRLRTEDIARFGQFLLNKGVWNGKRILASSWIEEATSCQVDNSSHQAQAGVTGIVDWMQGYGYQFWRCRHNAYRGDGAFGQYCIILPDQDAVIAINGGLLEMQGVLNAIWDILLPAMQEQQVEVDSIALKQLNQKLASLELGENNSSIVKWSGTKTYKIEDNEQGLDQISFTVADDVFVFEWLDRNGSHCLTIGMDDWDVTNQLAENTVAVKGKWRDSKTFVIYVYPIDSPHHDRLELHFEENTVTIQHEHLSFATLKHIFTGSLVKE